MTKYFAKFTESQTSVSGETKVLTSRALPDSLRLVDCDSIQVTYALSSNAADFNIQIERDILTSPSTTVGGYIRNQAGASRTVTITSSMEVTVISA